MLQAQQTENKLNVRNDTKEELYDVNYRLLFSISYLILNFPLQIQLQCLLR